MNKLIQRLVKKKKKRRKKQLYKFSIISMLYYRRFLAADALTVNTNHKVTVDNYIFRLKIKHSIPSKIYLIST